MAFSHHLLCLGSCGSILCDVTPLSTVIVTCIPQGAKRLSPSRNMAMLAKVNEQSMHSQENGCWCLSIPATVRNLFLKDARCTPSARYR